MRAQNNAAKATGPSIGDAMVMVVLGNYSASCGQSTARSATQESPPQQQRRRASGQRSSEQKRNAGCLVQRREPDGGV